MPGPYNSPSEALFDSPLRPELDPAQLLTELRALRPLIDRLPRLEPIIAALEQITVPETQEFRRAMLEHRSLMARIEHVGPQLDRIEALLGTLDRLEVIAKRG